MKATIEFDEGLYRRLKIEAVRRGRTVRELVAEGVRYVLATPPRRASEEPPESTWFGSLETYASTARSHDLAAIRESVARGRRAPRK